MNISQGWLVCPPLATVRETLLKCLLALCFCAVTVPSGTLSPSLLKEGRHQGLWGLPLGYGTLRYTWVSSTPPLNPWEVVAISCVCATLGAFCHFSSLGYATRASWFVPKQYKQTCLLWPVHLQYLLALLYLRLKYNPKSVQILIVSAVVKMHKESPLFNSFICFQICGYRTFMVNVIRLMILFYFLNNSFL